MATFGAPEHVEPANRSEVERVGSVEPVETEAVGFPASSARMAYEMEAAAHRETIEKLLAEKERLIGVLMGRVGDLENRLEAVESALQMEKLADDDRS